MERELEGARDWAWAEFGDVELGDVRRSRRCVQMAATAANGTAGTVGGVFVDRAAKQAAYDFLESKHTRAVELVASMGRACVDRSRGLSRVYVPIDGSSITLVDRKKTKPFGALGTRKNRGRGIKVITGLAINEAGVPLGIAAQKYWARKRPVNRSGSKYRPLHERESLHWAEVIASVGAAYDGSGVRPVCIIDREGDGTVHLSALRAADVNFVVRSSWNRRLAGVGRRYLRPTLAKQQKFGTYVVDVTANHKRTARRAQMSVRVARVTLDLSHEWREKHPDMTLNVVWTKELRPPAGEKPLDWMLLTDLPVDTFEQVQEIIRAYTMRWRIEEFHKSWKSGRCNVEAMQLRSYEAAITWATLLAAVATRVERLKQRSRDEPDVPASVELSSDEITALIILKRCFKSRVETIPDTMPSLATAVRWVAHLGGFSGGKNVKPGAITLTRGLERVEVGAMMVAAMRDVKKKR